MLDTTGSSGVASSLASGNAVAKDAGPPGAADFSRTKIATLFVVLIAIAAIPILLNPVPPLSDYINHLARMHVIASIGSDPDLSRYYEIDWQVIPNLMMDLIVPPLLRLMNVYLAGQVYTLLSFALIISGAVALHRQLFGHWSALPLIMVPLLYNGTFLIGAMNYVFGIGLALWALAAWAGLRDRSRALRLSISMLFVLGLFFCHLFALGVYGLGLLAFEAHRLLAGYQDLRRSSDRRAAFRALPLLIVDFLIAGLPLLPVLPLLITSPTWGLWGGYSWEPNTKIDGLVDAVEAYTDSTALVLIGVIAFMAGWALRDRALSFHPFGRLLLAIGAIVYLALPQNMFDTYMVDQRLPIALALMLSGCIDLDFQQKVVRRGFTVAAIVLAAVRVAEVESNWAALSAGTAAFRQSVQLIQRGAKVLVAYADPDGGNDAGDYGLIHADCIAIIERSALVTTAFTVVGKQILHARPEYRSRVDTRDGTPPQIDDLLQDTGRQGANYDKYWDHWTSNYDYLYVLFTDPSSENPDPIHLSKIFTGPRFVLYRIRSSPPAEAREISKQAPRIAKP
jgi:hypothetical protein